MTDYTFFDLFSISVIFISLFIAYFRGLTHEIFAILNWIFSAVLAALFSPLISPYLREIPVISDIIFENCELEVLTSIAFSFIVFLIIISLFTPIFSRIIQKSDLKGLDNSLGIFFGIIRGILIICGILLIHDNVLASNDYLNTITDSRTIHIVSDIMFGLDQFTPDDFKSWLLNQYNEMTKVCGT